MQLSVYRQSSFGRMIVLIGMTALLGVVALIGTVTSTSAQTADETENQTGMLALPETSVLAERVILISAIRSQNVHGFEAMEQSPMLYNSGTQGNANQQQRVDSILALRHQNLAAFDAMEAAPGLYTGQ